MLESIDTNNYYPFGLNHIGGSSYSNFGGYYNYKFGGKELQETGWSDFGARMYMSDLGRWGVIDPLAEKMTRHSTYNYAFSNPVNFVDPDGREGLGWGLKDGVWSWKSDLTENNYKERGFTEYKDDGSEIENSPIQGKEAGDTGKTYLRFGGEAFYLPTEGSNGSTGLLGLSNWFRDATSGVSSSIFSQFSGGWNSNFARGIVKDLYNVVYLQTSQLF
ncbi:RHS repeat-associated core domain-containing protein [Chryseobacterium sediminis]|uniref:RHS repeat-associated core domain-containing protein n=1 Tax=Chryseobacterium sediminis TaxID=1679494 RepID=A0A5B2U2X9_9FLAO|nr:RHS repeat-associated core domain-containing protein [Chryseobacterium sediminis]KAA2220660.1 hypothetical protein FW780_17455 [Chryseobacterium sediminis]